MKLSWFDTTELYQFAATLAEDYQNLRNDHSGGAKKRARRGQDMATLQKRAATYSQGLGINVYKKARLIEAIRAALNDRGVPDDEIELFVRDLILSPMRHPARRKAP